MVYNGRDYDFVDPVSRRRLAAPSKRGAEKPVKRRLKVELMPFARLTGVGENPNAVIYAENRSIFGLARNCHREDSPTVRIALQ